MHRLNNQQLRLIFGILGNVVSFVVFLAPIPTFYSIYKRKASEGYQSIPYAAALLSATLLLYYGSLRPNGTLIITINSFGCAIELLYLTLYIVYASSKAKLSTLKLLLLFNLGISIIVLLVTTFLFKGPNRVDVVGWICAVINVCVFAAPLSIMRRVIKTKSVEFMPFFLSFFLTFTATVWFFYGFFERDFYIAVPNVIGFLLGLAQMALYGIYRNSKTQNDVNLNKLENSTDVKPTLAHNNNPYNNGQVELKTVEVHV